MAATPRPTRARAMFRHERLTAWQACHAMTLAIYQETGRWSAEDLAALGQMVRIDATAAVTHIMLGAAAGSDRTFRGELRVTLGKLARVGCLLLMARDVGLLSGERWGELEASRDHAEQLTRGLYLAVGRAKEAVRGKR